MELGLVDRDHGLRGLSTRFSGDAVGVGHVGIIMRCGYRSVYYFESLCCGFWLHEGRKGQRQASILFVYSGVRLTRCLMARGMRVIRN